MMQNSFLKKIKPVSIGSAMADMALLLLIFFMATTTTEPPKGVEVELPEAMTAGAEQDSIYITIGSKGDIYFDGERVSLYQLNDMLRSRLSEKEMAVSITADRNLEYKIVSQLLGVLQDNDFLNVVFMSQDREKEDSL